MMKRYLVIGNPIEHSLSPKLHNFWLKKNNIWDEKELHSFLWLNLIDRKNDGKSLQKIIDSWIIKYSKYKRNLWENSVLSRRSISWVLNAEIILKNGSFYFKRNFST